MHKDISLSWNAAEGVVWHNAKITVRLDGTGQSLGPLFLHGSPAQTFRMQEIKLIRQTKTSLVLRGNVTLPGQCVMTVTRTLQTASGAQGDELTEQFELTGGDQLKSDLEVVRPFVIETSGEVAVSCALPQKNGFFSRHDLKDKACVSEYRLGNWIGDDVKPPTDVSGTLAYDSLVATDQKTTELALPVIVLQQAGRWQAAVCADPYFSAHFTVKQLTNSLLGECRYRYWSSHVSLEKREKRTFAFCVGAETTQEPQLKPPVDAFFRLALPEVKPGPAWTHEIYALYYDCMHQKGTSWKKDMDEMAKRFGPENTRHIAVCYHCWYDKLGAYSFDFETGKMIDEWECVPIYGQEFKAGKKQMHEQLGYAKRLGFKTIIYFGDGLADCSGRNEFRADWMWTSLRGKNPGARLNCWSPPRVSDGPPCFGRNPAHPEVIAWHHAYMKALLDEFGDVTDGFNWDETFHIGTGYVAARPVPSYSDRALMRLIRDLTNQVEAMDSEKVFFSSDAIGIANCWGQSYPNGVPGYAMVADGNWQDSACRFEMWPGALFPNWRNFHGSCEWYPYSKFDDMRKGAQMYGTPISFSTGGGAGCSNEPDDISSPHEWTDEQWNKLWIPAFNERKKAGSKRLRYLSVPPERVQTPADAAGGAQQW